MGPTASGKTDTALYLADHFPCHLISCDSALIYQDMDIGTAKPTRKERVKVPHHLIDIREPDNPYSAADFARDASQLIDEIRGRNRIPAQGDPSDGALELRAAAKQGLHARRRDGRGRGRRGRVHPRPRREDGLRRLGLHELGKHGPYLL